MKRRLRLRSPLSRSPEHPPLDVLGLPAVDLAHAPARVRPVHGARRLQLRTVLGVPGGEAAVAVAGVELVLGAPAEVGHLHRGLEDVEQGPGGRVSQHHEPRPVAHQHLQVPGLLLRDIGDC